MKTSSFFIAILLLLGLFNCTSSKYVISDQALSDDKVVILGVVEYDYSQLENRDLNGLQVVLDTRGRSLDFHLPEDNLKNNSYIRQQMISTIGKYGTYSLFNEPNLALEPEDVYSILKSNQILGSPYRRVIRTYDIEKGKIINIGKLTVKFTGGKVIDGKIFYTYSFQSNCSDTLALHVFKETNPMVYEKYANDVLSCNDK